MLFPYHPTTCRHLFLALALALGVSNSAQSAVTTFTFTGTISTSGIGGYAQGSQIQVVYVMNAVQSFESASGLYTWYEENLPDAEVFSTVSFTGTSGTWSRPSHSASSPESLVLLLDGAKDDLLFSAYADVGDDPDSVNGLTVGGVAVEGITVQAKFNNLSLGFLETPVAADAYFSNYLGNHDLVYDISSPSWIELASGVNVDFQVTNLVISQIPEPSMAVMSLAGAAVLLRRRRKD
jgi:hypothetical protein